MKNKKPVINKRLIKLVGFSLMLIMIFQLGKEITLPGFSIVQKAGTGSPMLHFLSMATGGNLMTPTLFSVGMGPYMTSMILWMTISLIDIDPIKSLTQAQQGTVLRVLTLIFSFLQSLILVMTYSPMIDRADYYRSFSYYGTLFVLVAILTAGGMIVGWFADMNMQKGVGMQMVLYLPGVVQGIATMLVSGSTTVTGAMKFNPTFFFGMIDVTLVFVYVTLYMYNAERRIPLQKTGVESKLNDSYLPIRLLNAGVMPFMFTSSIFQLPQLFMGSASFAHSSLGQFFTTFFSLKTVPGVITYGILFFALSMGFSYVNVRPHDIAKGLRESGDYILNIKPGHDTESYLTGMMTRIGLIGNTYLLCTSLIPLFIGLKYIWVEQISFYFGSVFFLIVITDSVYQSIKFVRDMNKYTIFE